MKVGVLTTSFPRHPQDDAGIFVQRLVEEFSNQGLSGVVVVPQSEREPRQETLGQFKVHRYKYGLLQAGKLAFGAGILPNIRRRPTLVFQVPLLIAQMVRSTLQTRQEHEVLHANWTPALLAAWITSFLIQRPYVATVRGEDIKLLQHWLFGWLCRAALRRARFASAVSTELRDQIQKLPGILPERVFCIPNGVSNREATPDEQSDFLKRYRLHAGPFLLFVGSVIPRKRIEVLCQALTEPALQKYSLLVCGRLADSAYVESLRALGRKLTIEQRLHFLGPVDPKEIPAALKISDYYVSASSFEGRSNAVLEALASGLIVVVSDIPAHSEIIEHGKNGLLFKLGDAKDLARLITEANSDVTRSNQIKTAAQAGVQLFSWPTCATQYAKLFAEARRA